MTTSNYDRATKLADLPSVSVANAASTYALLAIVDALNTGKTVTVNFDRHPAGDAIVEYLFGGTDFDALSKGEKS